MVPIGEYHRKHTHKNTHTHTHLLHQTAKASEVEPGDLSEDGRKNRNMSTTCSVC